MKVFKIYFTFKKLQKQMQLNALNLKKIQENKIIKLYLHAYHNIPFYQELFTRAGLTHNSIQCLEDIQKLPVISKQVLQGRESKCLLERNVNIQFLKTEQSSGSTGSPFTVYYDPNYLNIRNALFLRGLYAAGYRYGKKLFLLTGRPGNSSQKWLRWEYASIEDEPHHVYNQMKRFGPNILYGCTTALFNLAEYMEKNRNHIQVKKVITTAEFLESSTRRFLSAVFDVPIVDFYGMTEMGLIGWECSQGGYHLAEDSFIIEYLKQDTNSPQRIIITNLDQTTMPFIRFDTGDCGVPEKEINCQCGCLFPKLKRVEGRVIDSIQLKNGKKISPYKLTCKLEKIKELKRYQLVQENYFQYKVFIETNSLDRENTERQIKEILHDILGDHINLSICNGIKMKKSEEKFRVVTSYMKEGKHENPLCEL